MNPAPDQAELVHRMRQQLILVQVRIMELEDARDETANRLADCQQLLRSAQVVADGKIDEAAHLEKVRADLQMRHEELQHVQHATNEALNAARREHKAARETIATLEQRTTDQGEAIFALEGQVRGLEYTLQQANSATKNHLARLAELEGEVRAMKQSRSWRWTAWLRSIERAFARGPR
jgi:chromosome segregation ATPase